MKRDITLLDEPAYRMALARIGELGELDPAAGTPEADELASLEAATDAYEAKAAGRASAEEEEAVDDALGLRRVVLRLPVTFLRTLDELADREGLVRQAMIRELLVRGVAFTRMDGKLRRGVRLTRWLFPVSIVLLVWNLWALFAHLYDWGVLF